MSDPEQSLFPFPSTKDGNRLSLRNVVFIFECRKMIPQTKQSWNMKDADNSYTLGAYLDILLKLRLENV